MDCDDDYESEKINSLPPNCVTVETQHIRKVEELVIEEADLGEKMMRKEDGLPRRNGISGLMRSDM